MAELYRVALRGAATFTGARGVQWRRGQIRTLADPVQIAYYRRQVEFQVEPVREVAPSAPAPAAQPLPVSDPESPEDAATRFSADELSRLKKAELIELGADGFGLTLDPTMKKEALIAALLEAQGEE